MGGSFYGKGKYREMIRKRITYTYILLLLTIFPLCFWDYYYDIANVKFIVFTGMTLGTMIVVLICRGSYVLNAPVRWVFLWCGANILSFLLSSYKKTAFIGTGGRNYGLVTVFCITIMFVVVVSESSLPVAGYFSDAFIISSVLVSVLAVMNSYGIDFIGFYTGVRTDLRMFYQTTLGHVDICSSFFALALPVAAVSAIKENDKRKKVLYFVSSIIIFAGQFGTGCDSGYINIAVLIIAVIIYVKDYKGMFTFVVMGMVMLWTAKLMIIINARIRTARKMDSLSVMSTNTVVICIMSILLAVVAVYCYLKLKAGKSECWRFKKGFLLCIATAAGMIFISFIYFTFVDRQSDIGSLANLLRFSDEWGSCRGYVWRVTLERYGGLPWYNKIFGTGPDTLERVLTPVYGEEMLRRFDAFYDNAHNEYLQYLITTGIVGLAAYVGLIISSIKTGLTVIKSDDNAAPFMIAVVCYLVQAIVNINQVITTPLMFLCLAMIAFYKEE